MLTLKQILFAQNIDTARWWPLLTAEPFEQNLLAPVLPLMEYCYQEVLKSIPKSLLPKLAADLVFNTCKRDFKNLFVSLLSRVGVLEMHDVNAAGFLQGDDRERYQHYIQLLTEAQNCYDIISKYPVLEKNLVVYAQQYINVSCEFWCRLAADISELQDYFLEANSAYLLTKVESGGDKHKQGRSVAILTFSVDEKNTSVVYKPRSAAIDLAFNNLLSWFNQYITADYKQYAPRVLEKKEYSWHEFMTYDACQSIDEVKQFYQRAGGLLCIIYLLSGSDIHYENLIAYAAYPIVIDLECLLQPEYLRDAQQTTLINRPHVLTTGFLPMRLLADTDYRGYDISALAGNGGQPSPYKSIEWEEAGNVKMRVKRERRSFLASKNLPFILNQEINPLDYEADIIAGFNKYYAIILTHKDYLLSNESPLEQFKSAEIRLVLRNTSEYGKLLFESYHPELLYDATKTRQHFLWLEKQLVNFPELTKVLEYELADLDSGNIPAFYSNGDSDTLFDANGQSTAIKIIRSGYQRIKSHLEKNIDSSDLNIQLELIRDSYRACQANKNEPELSKWDFSVCKHTSAENNLDAMNAIAKQTLDQLAQLAFIDDDTVLWPTLTMTTGTIWDAKFTELDLYSGISGIGLTFALAGQLMANSQYLDLAKKVQTTLINLVFTRYCQEKLNIGAFSGYSGVIYALSQMQRIIPHGDTTQTIEKLLHKILEKISDDNIFDIIGGVAGCLLAIRSAHGMVDSKLLDQVSQQCVEHLLKYYPEPSLIPSNNNDYIGKQPLLGFSHGVAGIIYALAIYDEHTSDVRVAEWIKKGLAYERQQFSDIKQAWPDHRKISDGNHPHMWCHGSVGIGYSRLGLPKRWQDAETDIELKIAIDNTMKHGFGGMMNLCHGDLGNLDFLVEVNQRRPDLLSSTELASIVAPIIAHLTIQPIQTDRVLGVTGLMLGQAGVAYEMLRLLAPQKIPRILLLD